MTDRPLFQNTDEQEAVYAPQETADDAARERAMVEEGTLGENRAAGGTDDAVAGAGDDVGGALPLPGPGATGVLGPMGNISSSGSNPTVGSMADDDEDQSGR